MSISLKSPLGAAAALLASIVLAGCATDLQPPSPQKEQAARTRAEHEALATEFGRKAAAARSMAAEHREMARSFIALRALGRDGAYPNMKEHCATMAARYDGMASQYDGASMDHRRMGEGVAR